MSSLSSLLAWPVPAADRRRMLLLAAALAVGGLYSCWIDRPGWSDVVLTALVWGATLFTLPAEGMRLSRGLSLALAAFVLANLAAAAGSIVPYLSARAVEGTLAYLALFLLAGNVIRAYGHRLVWQALGLASAVLLLILVAAWFGNGAPLVDYRLTVETNNSLAFYNLLLLPGLAVGELPALVIGGALFVLWFSGSRGGLAGLIGGLLALGEVLKRQGVAASRWLGRQRWLGLGILLLASAILADQFLLPHGDRAALWGISWEMFRDRPWLGQGPASFQAFWLVAYPTAPPYGHAHNLLFSWLAETGLIGAGAGLAMIAAAGLALRRAWAAGSRWAPGVLAAAFALGIQSLVDVPTSQPYITVTLLILVQLALTPEVTDGIH